MDYLVLFQKKVDRSTLFNVIVGEELHESVAGIAASKVSEEIAKLDKKILIQNSAIFGLLKSKDICAKTVELIDRYAAYKKLILFHFLNIMRQK